MSPKTAASASVDEIVDRARSYFQTEATYSLASRRDRLRAFHEAIVAHESRLFDALYEDLHKPKVEAYTAEIGMTYVEIKHTLRHLRSWMKPERVSLPLSVWPARGYRYPEPRGSVLIISPWNYPFQLAAVPLVGAIAAGCSAVVKPSELSPATSSIFSEIVARAFGNDGYVSVIEGDADVSTQLLAKPWDLVFFTGSTGVGAIVMQAAARNLTPVVLELGGKSPAIVDEHADLAVAARRIAWGKYMNAGQTCVAPDYALVHRGVKQALVDQLGAAISALYGQDPASSPDYARIVTDRHFDRLVGLMSGGRVAHGGKTDRATRFIAPTVLTDVDLQHALMQEEIFGPLLPVIEVDDVDQAIQFVRKRPKPLALYVFTNDGGVSEKVLRQTSFGGGTVNDTLIHMVPVDLPFGGIGGSGMGAYHGKASFDVFTHHKSVLKRKPAFDIKMRYPPYRSSLSWLRYFYE